MTGADTAFVLPTQSTPTFSEFYPHVPYQRDVIDEVFHGFDYSLGVLEILLSGSVGSAKSLLMAHIGLRHLFTFPRSRILIGRQSMPDLRDTIYAKILEHLIGTVKSDGTIVREGVDFGFADTRCHIWIANGSEFIARSWKDKRFKRLGSLDLSGALIEEVTENGREHWAFWNWVKTRVGRLPHVPQNFIIGATNPDGPSHPAYDYFEIERRQALREARDAAVRREIARQLSQTKRVYFSNTRDNRFLPTWYIAGLEETLDAKNKRRLVDGEWVEINSEVVYHAYGRSNFVSRQYDIDVLKPIHLCFDFNIGQGKPMSACAHQLELREATAIRAFHFFADYVVDGADTEDLMEEIAGRGLFDIDTEFVIHGDATGAARSTKSKKSDYDIIRKFLSDYRRPNGSRVSFKLDVPAANPPIRSRHNIVNGYCRNSMGKTRLFVYAGAKILDKGFRLTALKPGGLYVEDDTKPYQHVTTAAGYSIVRIHRALTSTSGLTMEQIR